MGDLAEIVRVIGDEYVRTRRTTPFQRKALLAIERCRTEAMGSVIAACGQCGSEHRLWRSCKNRNCPRCQFKAAQEWLDAREQELLEVPYFHVVFTVPAEFNPIALYCPEVFYAALMSAAGNALLDVGRSKLKARLGCMTVLHTWGQNLSLHPHVHCVVPGGGFSSDLQRWISVRNPFYLLPNKVLASRFRTLLCRFLRAAAEKAKLTRLPSHVVPHTIIESAFAKPWVVYSKPPFGGPEQVLEYLSQYTHRIAISNRRILSFENGCVTFEWRDYRDGNRIKQSTLDANEFLRRFLMHVLPSHFKRIRYFGFLANLHRRRNIERARTLIGHVLVASRPRLRAEFLCPACRTSNACKSDPPLLTSQPIERPPPNVFFPSHSA